MRRLGIVPPFMGTSRGQLAATRLPVFGDAFQAAAQPRREKIDRFSRGLCLDLSADKPAIDIEIGLRDARAAGPPGHGAWSV